MNPTELLNRTSQEYPEIWNFVDRLWCDKGKGLPNWPEHIFLPMAAWYTATCHSLGVHRLCLPEIVLMHKLATIGTWRITQDLVRLDADVYKEVASVKLDGSVPADALLELPSWSAYVDMKPWSMHKKQIRGFFAFLEHDVKTVANELRISYLYDEGMIHVVMPLGDWPLDAENLAQKATFGFDYEVEDPRESKKNGMPALTETVNILLFLCAHGFLQETAQGDKCRQYNRPSPKALKNGGVKFYPPLKPNQRILGDALGTKLRQAMQQGATPLHAPLWQGQWQGSSKPRPDKKGNERRYELKFVSSFQKPDEA